MNEKTEERHASWLELFFDLVAVAGVAQLAHLVHGSSSWGGAGLYVVCFLAFWTAWMCFTVYGNVTGDAAHTLPVLLAMAGLVFMAASVSGIRGEHAVVFAGAYVGVRGLASRMWEGRRGARVIAEWPVVHAGMGVIPWIVSIWVDSPWRYGLWALGLALDLVITFAVSGERLTTSITAKLVLRGQRAERAAFARLARRDERPEQTAFARLDLAHFGERLGLFTIIVLGEGVLTITETMTEIPEWSRSLYWTAIAALALLATLWGGALHRGFAGIPHLSPDKVGPRVLLPLHCLVAGLLAVLAGGLGDVVEAAEHGQVEVATRWLLCGCVAAFAVIGSVCGLVSGHRPRWAFVALAAGLVIPLALGFFGDSVTPARFLWLLVVAAGASAAGSVLARRRRP
ncbi:low temperature requirement protein A [Amycolatopsis jiangsuensis]|uniref:Low temperature requirement protein LtrA n=1 Tax=Amycolatopsis jiangsuensis TaxID=1181879 RepID=A0A840ITR0_9PSEU|nr:low temperature requirement protein A [Amycolatopsis jiangsuensis]MBB4684845.1 low temperature requirement protein LtrA [Amycolatopsis jiangsuensis]